MKKTVYTQKQGKLVLSKLSVRKLRRRMMSFSGLSVPVFVDQTSGATVIQTLKRGIKIAVTKLLESSKKSEMLLQRSNQEILSLRLSPMAVASVTPVALAMMELAIAILEPTGLMECRQSTCVLNMQTGHL